MLAILAALGFLIGLFVRIVDGTAGFHDPWCYALPCLALLCLHLAGDVGHLRRRS